VCSIEAGSAPVNRTTSRAIVSTSVAVPVPTLNTWPRTASIGAARMLSIAAQVSSTKSQSRAAVPSPWTVKRSPRSALVMKRGTSFSRCCPGP
jgi:hypothetical protein